MNKPKQTICILYGWAEGGLHGRKLRRCLRLSDFELTKNPQKADILLAHSGGVYSVPDSTQAKLIMLVGMPHWPGKSPYKSSAEKTKLENKNFHFAKKLLWNGIYFAITPKKKKRMKHGFLNGHIPTHEQIVLVRNQYDSFLHPEESVKLASELGWKFIELPGGHDDIWANPQPYVDIIKTSI